MANSDDLILRAAWMYYVDDRNQEQIARDLAVSRPTVSRLLRRARDEGIVEIRVRGTLPEVAQQEQKLLAAFPQLEATTVAPDASGEHPRTAVARTGAQLVEDLVAEPGATLTVGWGRTLGEMASLVRQRRTDAVTICDAVGHAPEIPGATSLEVTRRLAESFGATSVHLPTPAMMRPRAAAKMLLGSEQVKWAMRRAQEAPTAVVSLGGVTDDTPLIRPGLLTTEEWDEILAQGIVGDVLGHFLDADGEEHQPADVAWVGLSLDDLRRKERVLGLVVGQSRAMIASIAIRAGVITHLVTNAATVPDLLACAADDCGQANSSPAPAADGDRG